MNDSGLLDAAQTRLRRRINGSRVIVIGAKGLAPGAVILGLALYGARLLDGGLWAGVAVAVLGLTLAGMAFFAIWKTPKISTLAAGAQLDLALGSEGLIMGLLGDAPNARAPGWNAIATQSLEGWTPPPWPHRTIFGLVLAMGAVVLGAVLPLPPLKPTVTTPQWDAVIQQAADSVAAHEDAGLIAPEEAEVLQARLKALAEGAEKHGGAQALWQGVDAVEAALDRHVADVERGLGAAVQFGQEAAAALAAGAPGVGAEGSEPQRGAQAALQDALDAIARAEAAAAGQLQGQGQRLRGDAEAALAAASPGGNGEAGTPGAGAQAGADAGRSGGLNAAQRKAAQAAVARLNEALAQGAPGAVAGVDPAAAARLRTLIAEAAAGAGMAGAPGMAGGAPGRGGGSEPDSLMGQASNLGADPSLWGHLEAPPGAQADGNAPAGELARAPDIDAAAKGPAERGPLIAPGEGVADGMNARVAPRHRGAVGRYFSIGSPTPAQAPPSTP